MLHIGISGPIASGKSTLAIKLRDIARGAGYVAEIVPFASGIREIIALEHNPRRIQEITLLLRDWGYPLEAANYIAEYIDTAMDQFPSTPGTKNRRLLQIIGTDIGRNKLDPRLWIVRTKQLIRTYGIIHFAISDDLRFDNEADAVDAHIEIIVNTDDQRALYDHRISQYAPTYLDTDHSSERSLTRRALFEIPIGFTDNDVVNLLTYLKRYC